MDKWDRKIVVAITLIFGYLVAGTILFHAAEGWSYVDAFYFSGVTLSTVGYGDLTPTLPTTKILVVFFAFSGIGIVFYSISIIAQKYFEREEERLQKIWETAKGFREERRNSRKMLIHSAKQDTEKTAAVMRK
jgi:hypothetical protein